MGTLKTTDASYIRISTPQYSLEAQGNCAERITGTIQFCLLTLTAIAVAKIFGN